MQISQRRYQVTSIRRNHDGSKAVEFVPELEGQPDTFAAGPVIPQTFPAETTLQYEQIVVVTITTA